MSPRPRWTKPQILTGLMLWRIESGRWKRLDQAVLRRLRKRGGNGRYWARTSLAGVARSAALSRNRLICRHFCEGHGAPISTLGNFLQLLMWSQSGQPALLGQ